MGGTTVFQCFPVTLQRRDASVLRRKTCTIRRLFFRLCTQLFLSLVRLSVCCLVRLQDRSSFLEHSGV